MRSREEALELTLKQIDRIKWEPETAEQPDIGTELVLYLMEKNAALKEALEGLVRAVERRWPNSDFTTSEHFAEPMNKARDLLTLR